MKTIKLTQVKIRTPLAILLIIVALQSTAQKTAYQNWNSISAKFALSKKTDLRISQLAAFSPADQFQAQFHQTAISLGYDISKKITLKAGDQFTYIPGSSRPFRNRVFVNAAMDRRFLYYFKTAHAIQAEFHHRNEIRYSKRLIFRNGISLRKRFSFLKLKPSVSYWLYYNMGGAPIQYYDKSGSAVMTQTPDGFHRGRLYFTLNSRFSKTLSLSAYYMIQKEFNLFTPAYRNINVINPSNGKIHRPYDDGKTLGMSMAFSFRRRTQNKP